MDVKEANLAEFVKGVQAAMHVIDKYETSRPGALSFTHLEEAILWAQVLVGQIALKSEPKSDIKEGELLPNG